MFRAFGFGIVPRRSVPYVALAIGGLVAGFCANLVGALAGWRTLAPVAYGCLAIGLIGVLLAVRSARAR